MTLKQLRHMIIVAIVFGLFDYQLGQFLLSLCVED